jgi:hypothetical protein
VELFSVAVEVEPERRGVDEVEVERVDVDASVPTDPEDAFADTVRGILGEIDENRRFYSDVKAPETWRS